jgi:CHAT domain-containing protein
MVVMPNGAQMEKKYLSNYRNAIKYQVTENYSYLLFWKPLATKLGNVEKIYFSPDGVYNQISIYTLRNPDTKQYTIDEFEIQLVTNTKDLVSYNFDTKTELNRPSYLFGFPNYNMGAIDKKIQEMRERGEIEEQEEEEEERGIRGTRGVRGADAVNEIKSMSRGGSIPRGIRGNMLRYMSSNSLLSLLPGTQKEVNLIDSLHEARAARTITFMDDEAVEDEIKKIENPQTLHVATHGFFLEQPENADAEIGEEDKYVGNPLLRSGLILAGANSYINTGSIEADRELNEDGILTAFEAMNLNLNDTELVVLSACETGLGEVQNGEGVYGLQRSFQVAGAKAIIMSMWTVDDAATQELMTMFYEEWLVSGDKHQAFIKAQKRLKEKYKKPYYWGAFVMLGN